MLELVAINAFYDQSHILHDISLSMGEGARVAVLGRNGSGKTTLLKSIMNAGPRVVGTVTFRSQVLGDRPPNQRTRLGLTLVPEDRRVFGHLTTYENLKIAQYGSIQDRAFADVDELLARFPMLRPLRDRPGSRMSGGQQQMLAVARGISARPYLMLLDEPTEGLAPTIVEELAEQVVSCCETYAIGLLLAEQSIWFARQCTDRAIVIDTGRIAFAGTWQDFDRSIEQIHRHLAF
jgi:ABC-type branched-subunit amino acid transport system ATPase component